MNILFVCSRNEWRSATAETIYKNHSFINVKSAGTSPSARVKINSKHLDWADIIFVMEKKHLQLIKEKFDYGDYLQKVIILDVPDDYHYMDQELIDELQAKVSSYL